jgi:CBS domain-containing protein
MTLARGLKRHTPHGFFERIGNLFSSDDTHSVDKAVNLSGRNPFYGLPLTGNLAQAARVMADKGVHRVAVVDMAHHKVTKGVITQSMVLRVIHEHIGVIGELGSAVVGSLFATGGDAVPFCEPRSASAREVLQTLLLKGYQGCPIVDDGSGAIIANVSVSDIRNLAGMSAEDAEANLDRPALWLVSPTHSDESAPRPPITVRPSDTLSTVIGLIVTSRVHRVYIVDERNRPIGIVTLTDLLRLLLSPTIVAHDVAGAGLAAVSETKAGDGTARVAEELVATIRGTTVESFVESGGLRLDTIHDVACTTSVTDVLELLARHRVSALPVYREEEVRSPALVGAGLAAAGGALLVGDIPSYERKYIGWVDVADIASLILDRGVARHSEGVWNTIATVCFDDKEHRSAEAVNRSNNNPFWAIATGQKMDKVGDAVRCVPCRCRAFLTRDPVAARRSSECSAATSCTASPWSRSRQARRSSGSPASSRSQTLSTSWPVTATCSARSEKPAWRRSSVRATSCRCRAPRRPARRCSCS